MVLKTFHCCFGNFSSKYSAARKSTHLCLLKLKAIFMECIYPIFANANPSLQLINILKYDISLIFFALQKKSRFFTEKFSIFVKFWWEMYELNVYELFNINTNQKWSFFLFGSEKQKKSVHLWHYLHLILLDDSA